MSIIKNTISISEGNIKEGNIHSVSVPPIATCNPDLPCFPKCYAVWMMKRWGDSPSGVKQAWERNLRIYRENPDDYFDQVSKDCKTQAYFRWHVGGDIVDALYFEGMIRVANENPQTLFRYFTKKYEIVNTYCDEHGHTRDCLPKNLITLFSQWDGYELVNPYNFPVVHVILKGQEPDPDWKICGGNCMDCICKGIGCWTLLPGDHLGIYEHGPGTKGGR